MAHLNQSVYFSPESSEEPVEDLSSTVVPQDFGLGGGIAFEGAVERKEHVDLGATVLPEVEAPRIPKKVTIVEADNVLRDRVKYLERLVELLVEQRAPGSAEIIDVEVVDFRGKRRVVPAVAQRTVVVAKERVVEVAHSNLLDSV